jgi:hypothetical protein
LDPTVKAQTLAQLYQLIDLYAFTDVVANSGEPFYMNVDLRAELNRISQTSYSSDYLFHDDLRELFSRLGDAHTLYYSPTPYRSFYCGFPFLFQATTDNPFTVQVQNVTYMANTIYPQIGSQKPVDLTFFIGQTVLTVNGSPVSDFIQWRGDMKGYSRSPSTRFNVAFLYNMPLLFMGMGGPLPDFPTWSIGFATENGDPYIVNVPVTCSVKKDFSGVDDLRRQILGSPATLTTRSAAKVHYVALDCGYFSLFFRCFVLCMVDR